jgi:Ni,Fe-hydrogenase maturation factor
MSPKTLLSISKTIYDRVPEAILVSVRGYKFEFERKLSPKTAELVDQATGKIWDWIHKNN